MNENALAILSIVRLIPEGKVATYGQIARIAGLPKNARQVGRVLRELPPDTDVPWFRVINAKGEISSRGSETVVEIQRSALEAEGISLDSRGRIPLAHHAWKM